MKKAVYLVLVLMYMLCSNAYGEVVIFGGGG